MNIPQAPSRSSIGNTRLRARVGLVTEDDEYGYKGTTPSAATQTIAIVSWVGAITGTALGAYHGYGRNRKSVGWAIGWGLLGGAFWPLVIPIMLFQGLGKPVRG